LSAFFYGSGTFLEQLWIPRLYGQTLVAVVVVGFAMTTLDTGTRLLRYNIEELADSIGAKKFVNRYLASFAAVVLLAFVALFKVPSAGPGGAIVYKPAGFIVWQLFGTSNQLLGALGLLVVTVYLIKTGKPSFYTAIPFAFMLFVTGWSLVERLAIAWSAAKPELRSWPVVIVGIILIVVTVWLAIEALVTVVRVKCGWCETTTKA
jgi:carbon starvation protein